MAEMVLARLYLKEKNGFLTVCQCAGNTLVAMMVNGWYRRIIGIAQMSDVFCAYLVFLSAKLTGENTWHLQRWLHGIA